MTLPKRDKTLHFWYNYRSMNAFFRIFLIAVVLIVVFLSTNLTKPAIAGQLLWEFQAIDTMKYSRDTAREKLSDPSFDLVIDRQIAAIKETGATHVGIATPYDEEFYPFLKRWVDSARKHGLKVWFRGNMSGWEGWFEYPKIDRATHTRQVVSFIKNHPELFEDGDAFSSCPECENGGPGDPRLNGDPEGHKRFLIDEYNATTKAFDEIGKDVESKYHSMNGDVARLIMDDQTTKAMGNAVVVDHYVKTPEQLAEDIVEYSNNGEHDVILGEFGAPIPDIHGKYSQEQQAQWIDEALSRFVLIPNLTGLSYWTNVGGSTELWDGSGKARLAVDTIKKYFSPSYVHLSVKNDIGQTVTNAKVYTLNRLISGENGVYEVPVVSESQTVVIEADGYKDSELTLSLHSDAETVRLAKEYQDFWYKVQKLFMFLFYK